MRQLLCMSMESTTRRCLVFFMAVFCAVQGARAQKISGVVPIPCDNVNKFSTSNTNMYNVAYAWTHHKKIVDWSYGVAKHAGKECAVLDYKAPVHIPEFFQNLGLSTMNLQIKKEFCTGKFAEERVTIRNIPIIDQLKMSCISQDTKTNNKVSINYTCEVAWDVPWYMIPLQDRIWRHIQESIGEYMKIIALSRCQRILPRNSKKHHNLVTDTLI